MQGPEHVLSRPEFIKKNFLCSAEHEILNAHKYKNIKKFSFFSGSDKPRMLFLLLLNVKMPTIVGILIFMSRNSCWHCWHFNIYEQE